MNDNIINQVIFDKYYLGLINIISHNLIDNNDDNKTIISKVYNIFKKLDK